MNTNKQILLIEDDPAIAKPLKVGLEREGFLVTWKTLGEEGIKYTCEHQPHLILLDVRLPDISGFDVCARIRQFGFSLPILMLTVHARRLIRYWDWKKGLMITLPNPSVCES